MVAQLDLAASDSTGPLGVRLLLPRSGRLPDGLYSAPLRPFDDTAVAFCAKVSKAILLGGRFRAYPEMLAFGHWLRKASVLSLKSEFESRPEVRQARGNAFHIAPKNVDTIFLYSMFLSLLAGNSNVVRVSASLSDQVQTVIDTLAEVLEDPEFAEIASRLAILTYPHDAETSAWFSRRCDVRVVWGGDSTVEAIREVPLPPHARDLGFPNKWSVAVFDCATVMAMDEGELADNARKFTLDTYWFGQMACSSPRAILWLGDRDEMSECSQRFWGAVEAHLEGQDFGLGAVDVVNKRVAEDTLAMQAPGIRVHDGRGGLLNIVEFDALSAFGIDEHCGAGLFYQTHIERLEELDGFLGRTLQTVVSLGIPSQDWRAALKGSAFAGIDRIVPVGAALDFSPHWDGLDLMGEYTRALDIQV